MDLAEGVPKKIGWSSTQRYKNYLKTSNTHGVKGNVEPSQMECGGFSGPNQTTKLISQLVCLLEQIVIKLLGQILHQLTPNPESSDLGQTPGLANKPGIVGRFSPKKLSNRC
jgi:hypothetical protein